MPVPLLTDDGTAVTLDLHGARVAEAAALVRAVVRSAADRGRLTVRLVHGASTSDPLARNATVKHAVHRLLDDGALADAVASAQRAEGHTLLGLRTTRRPDPARLSLRDLRP